MHRGPSSSIYKLLQLVYTLLRSTYVPSPEKTLYLLDGDIANILWIVHLQFRMEECHKLLTDRVDDAILRYNVSKPLPLGGEPGHVGRHALSISKMKVAYYPDVGLEQLVPDQFWIEEECKYDIAAINLVIRQHVEDFQLGIESYQTQINLTKPRWEATGYEFKHDYTVIDSPRAVTFRDKYGVQMIMRFNEIHKFSDGTLHRLMKDWTIESRSSGSTGLIQG
ncbi:hypothetical protein Tco_0664864 [Tanacetum coccineum]